MTLVFLGLSGTYLVNLFQWSRGPVFGWSISNQMDKTILTSVYGPAARSGLRAGDRVLSVNGRPFEKMLELQRRLNREAGQVNVYKVSRSGTTLEITVPNEPLGLQRAFWQYGFTWVFGLAFFFLGTTVYVMKPGVRPSWVFLNMMFCLGLLITYSFTSKLAPVVLNLAVTFSLSFLPATVAQLTITFPEERKRFADHKLLFWAPYGVSLILFATMVSTGIHASDVSPSLRTFTNLYLASSLLLFLAFVTYTYIRSSSDIARVRSRVVLIGSALAIVFPVLNLLSMQFFSYAFLPHPAFNLPFYLFFPLSIAFAIARHNLFDVDVYIKRAVGYTIMTLLVGSIYFSIQVGVKAAFSASAAGAYSDRIYPVIFAILVVFLFNPLNSRIQGLVDRLFYRKKFDYKDTVLTVSNALTTVFNLDEIIRKIIGTVRQEMYIDSAGVVLLRQGDPECEAVFFEDDPQGGETMERQERLSFEDPIISIVTDEKKLLTRYDVMEDARYDDIRESTSHRFADTGTSLVIPMLYQDQVTAILALGNKKSGHFYTREDIDLLETLCAQGAVALENARLFEENLEKGRMEEELKIAHDLQMAMLPDAPPELTGAQVAARSIPAQEVGGDFFDFIQIPGEDGIDRLGIVVADVSGKAVSGALVMAATRSVFRILSGERASVSEVMSIANARLKGDVKKGMFVALLYATLDPVNRSITLANAGQTQPLLIRKGSDKPQFLETEGDRFPLGIVDGCSYQEARCDLEPGDVVVMYTDGVVEAINDSGEMYGFDHFLELISTLNELAPEPMLERIISDITNFVGNTAQHDDITIMVVKVT